MDFSQDRVRVANVVEHVAAYDEIYRSRPNRHLFSATLHVVDGGAQVLHVGSQFVSRMQLRVRRRIQGNRRQGIKGQTKRNLGKKRTDAETEGSDADLERFLRRAAERTQHPGGLRCIVRGRLQNVVIAV